MVPVELDRVTKRFGDVAAVDEVALEIAAGELFFLLGPSGCGKTTLLRMIAGFYEPDGGTIRFGAKDMTTVPPHKRNTGMVFQNYALWPHMSVFENVAYGLDVRRVDDPERKTRVETALDVVLMREYAERMPNQLSGGQQQRIALARALVIEPDVVLLDEPLSNLDAKLRLDMRDEIRHIHERVGVTMIYVTHDQSEALSMADRMAVMENGHVRQVGSPRDVYQAPNSVFVAGFIGETNMVRGRLGDDRAAVETVYGPVVADLVPEGLANGEVVCSIRPEAMSVAVDEPALSGGSFEGVVESVTYLGDVEQYVIMLSDDLRIRCIETNLATPRAEVGTAVSATFEARDVVLLPPE
jgi:iron(III) transport system ATP-binding protein